MDYPTIPFALVNFLAGICKERAAVPANVKCITIAIHSGVQVRSARLEITNDEQFAEISKVLSSLCAQGPFDTIAILYPTVGLASIDAGILMHGYQDGASLPDMIFEWTWAPEFQLHLVDDGLLYRELESAVGRSQAHDLLKIHSNRQPMPMPMLAHQDDMAKL